MDHAVAVCIADRVGDLPRKIQAEIEGQGWSSLAEEVVEPEFVGFAAE